MGSTVGFGVVVGVFDAHVVEGTVVGDGEALSAEGEEVTDNRAVLLVPLALGQADFLGDDFIELAQKRVPRDSGDHSHRGDVVGVDVAPVHEVQDCAE